MKRHHHNTRPIVPQEQVNQSIQNQNKISQSILSNLHHENQFTGFQITSTAKVIENNNRTDKPFEMILSIPYLQRKPTRMSSIVNAI